MSRRERRSASCDSSSRIRSSADEEGATDDEVGAGNEDEEIADEAERDAFEAEDSNEFLLDADSGRSPFLKPIQERRFLSLILQF